MLSWVKKYICLFLLLSIILPQNSFAIMNCNEFFGIKCKKHQETWAGETKEHKTNCMCPPYRKTKRTSCLKQFGLAGAMNMVYNRYCAEESPESTFFAPKIRVRTQTCNVACWTMMRDLNGHGGCRIFPGAFGLPTTRLCARLAVPAEKELGKPADHGYTYAWHLNKEGAPTQDPIYPGDDGKPIYMAKAKICAYWDPSLYDAIGNYASFLFGGVAGQVGTMMATAGKRGVTNNDTIKEFALSLGIDPKEAALETADLGDTLQATLQPDLWDNKPHKQAIHYHEGGVFILFQLIIQLVKMGVGMGDMITRLIDSLPDGLKFFIMMVSRVYWIIKLIVTIGEHVIVPVLEYLGQFNNVVAASIGCVLIPLGPFPPPYCEDLRPTPVPPKVTPICRSTKSGREMPDPTNQCVNSREMNNIIHNAVRVGFNELMPLCKRGQTPGDICVKVHPFIDAATMHKMTKNLDVVNVCDSTNSNLPCVESPTLVEKCKKDPVWCKQGIRVVYGSSAGPLRSMIQDYYDSTATSCLPGQTACQYVWGVNVGNFKDITAIFPSVERKYNSSNLTSSAHTIVSPNGEAVKARILIPRIDKKLVSGREVSSSHLYVINSDDNVIGVAERPIPPKPSIYDCGGGGITCNTNHLKPAMGVKLQVGSYSTKGALSAESEISAPAGSVRNIKLNLAGFEYRSFVTDKQYTQEPFEGPNAITPSTIHGDYIDGKVPYDNNGRPLPGDPPLYLEGLEYFGGKYVLGGEQICLTGYQFDDCFTSQSTENCVLSQLLNSDFVKCSDFYNRVLARFNNNISMCTDSEASSYSVQHRVNVRKPMGGNVTIKVRGASKAGPFCYDYGARKTRGKLCEVSQIYNNRITPTKAFGPLLPAHEHYDFDKLNPPNGDLLSVRNKNAIEHGLCVDVPPPQKCRAIEEKKKYIKYNASDVGDRAKGVCIAGFEPKGPDALLRYCAIDRRSGNSIWQKLDTNMGCKKTCSITTNIPTVTYDKTHKWLSLKSSNATGEYKYHVKFGLANKYDMRNFKLLTVNYDDAIKITINGNEVFPGRGGTFRPGIEVGGVIRGHVADSDMKRYLKDGENEIEIHLSVTGTGQMYVVIQAELRGCKDLKIK